MADVGQDVLASRDFPYFLRFNNNHVFGGVEMKKERLFLACLGVLFLSSVSFATIVSVNANYVDGGFTASGGDFGIGVFSLSDTADIVVEETGGGQTTYSGGSFSMTTSLENDVSVGTIASGEFSGGSPPNGGEFSGAFSVKMKPKVSEPLGSPVKVNGGL